MTGRTVSMPVPASGAPTARVVALGAAVLAGTAAALLLAVPLLAPTASELRLLAAYVLASSAAATVVGWGLLQALDRLLHPSLAVRAFAGTVAGGLAGLLNVLLVARLMFVNTSHDLRLLVVLIVSGTAVSVFFAVAVSSMTARRLEAVALAIRRLAQGDYSAAHMDEAHGGREVARLTADVDQLRERLLEAQRARDAVAEERRELGAAVAHDLRTPIASMRAVIEALDDGLVDDPAEVRGYYGHLRRETQRLGRMIDDLFELAQLDAGSLPLELGPIQLAEVVSEVIDAMRPLAAQRGITLNVAAQDALPTLNLDAARMERAVANLVRNAIEHSPAGTTIEARLTLDRTLDGAWALLCVQDQGEGIAPTELPHIWDRFYRGEPSRRRQAGLGDGAGLGLAIVRGIVEAHRGRVAARSTPGHGSTFELRLPLP